ncbi:unnamed protein product [Closterium sp. Yama58-4]|nr:unnamed protein product [Closterium sp. Yama58-4]
MRAAQSSAKAYPLCPFTQKPPAKPNVTMARCVDATERACCADCSDTSNALHGITANQTVVLQMLKPEIVAIIGNKDVQQCAMFVGFDACSYDLEQLFCAITCNPDGGTYVKASTATTGVLTVCDAYATQVYSDCENVPMMGQATLGSLLSNKEIFIKLVFGLLFARFSGINVTVNVAQGTSACYNGPINPLPPKPVCCDPFTNTPGCSFKDDPLLAPYVGRPINPIACAAYINGTAANGGATSASSSSASYGSSGSPPPKEARKTALSSVFMFVHTLHEDHHRSCGHAGEKVRRAGEEWRCAVVFSPAFIHLTHILIKPISSRALPSIPCCPSHLASARLHLPSLLLSTLSSSPPSSPSNPSCSPPAGVARGAATGGRDGGQPPPAGGRNTARAGGGRRWGRGGEPSRSVHHPHYLLSALPLLCCGACMGAGLAGIIAAHFAKRVILTDTGDAVLRNCAANVDDAANAARASSAATGCSPHPRSPVPAARVRRLDWRHGWPPPVVTSTSGLHQSATSSGSSSAAGRAAGAQAEMDGAADPFNGIDPFGWTEEDVSDASNATVLLAADVIYSDDITCAFFTTLRSLLRCGPPKLLLLAMEKRFNFSLSHLAPVANGYAVFRSHFAAQNAAPSCYSAGHCISMHQAAQPGDPSCILAEHTDGGGRQKGVDRQQSVGNGEGEGEEGEEGEELLGWRMDVGRVPQHVVGWERGSDMELWIIATQRSLPLVCAWMDRGDGLFPCEGGEEELCSPAFEHLQANA